MEIIKNKARWEVYAWKCIKHYNITNNTIYDQASIYQT